MGKNNNLARMIFAGALAVILIVQIYPIATSYALFGVGDIGTVFVSGGFISATVTDPVHTAATTGGWIAEAGRFLLDQGLKVALQALKKRLLDTMTDQIVNWINGGGKPKFTQDFGSVFRSAADAAVGDVLQQYSATNALCQPFAFDITLQLQQPAPLSQQVSCSLTSVISSYKAYRDNFSNGGWLAYQELLKPQNNEWGAEIITQNEIINRTNQKTNASVLQQQVNVGFNSESCDLWQLTDERNNLPVKGEDTSLSGTDYPDPNTQPPIPPPYALEQSYYWKCVQKKVSTPGRALAAGLEKSLYSGLDLVISAQDLSNALAVIADAAFNRLIKAGVDGLKSIGQSSTSGQDLQQAANDYQSTQNQVTANVRNTYLGQLNSARDALSSASTTLATASSTNQQIIVTGNDLLTCLGTGSVSSTDVVFAQGAVDDANDVIQTIANELAQWNIATSTLSNLTRRIGSLACDLTCLNQIGQQNISDAVNTANALNIDLSNMLIGIQGTLSDLKIRRLNDCHS